MFKDWRRMAVPKGHCPECDFDLSGLDPKTAKECPECGRLLAPVEVTAAAEVAATVTADAAAAATSEPAPTADANAAGR
jgi:hypothetical protein